MIVSTGNLNLCTFSQPKKIVIIVSQKKKKTLLNEQILLVETQKKKKKETKLLHPFSPKDYLRRELGLVWIEREGSGSRVELAKNRLILIEIQSFPLFPFLSNQSNRRKYNENQK